MIDIADFKYFQNFWKYYRILLTYLILLVIICLDKTTKDVSSVKGTVFAKKGKCDMKEEVDILNIILDKSNHDTITFVDGKGRDLVFEQLAVIPLSKDWKKALYVVLQTVEEVPDFPHEPIVFKVVIKEDEPTELEYEFDEKTVTKVYEIYNKLCDDNRDQ